jgi:hypothetical protein
MLRSSKFSKLEGLKEYRVKVKVMDGISERLVCNVRCFDKTGVGTERWVDEITGQFYSKDGECLSGNISFLNKPRLTGRLVPDIEQRALEAKSKSLLNEYGDEE